MDYGVMEMSMADRKMLDPQIQNVNQDLFAAISGYYYINTNTLIFV